MTTIKEIETALERYAVATTGEVWIFQTEEEAPQLPYGEIKLLTLRQIGTPTGTQTKILPDDIESKADAMFLITYQFTAIGDNASQTILELINKSNLEQYQNMLKEDGIGFLTFSGQLNLTGLDFDKVRQRATTEMNFNAVLTAEEIVPFIKTVEVEYVPANEDD